MSVRLFMAGTVECRSPEKSQPAMQAIPPAALKGIKVPIKNVLKTISNNFIFECSQK